MIRAWGPRACAAAALLSAAVGCDYWNNLVDQKKVAEVPVTITVKDAWTGEPVQASCAEEARGIHFETGADGTWVIPEAATGGYSVSCAATWYRSDTLGFTVGIGGAQAAIDMARDGGPQNWYRDAGRAVAIQGVPESLRYPADLDWAATPADSGRFRYEWTFRRSGRLNRGHVSESEPVAKEALSPRFRAHVSVADVQEGKDTIDLKVFSLLKGAKHAYLADSFELPIEWVRNRKPYLSIDNKGNIGTFQVGCDAQPQPRVIVNLSAHDTDGTCRMIRVRGVDAPSLEGLDTTLPCREQMTLRLPLHRPDPTAPRRLLPDGTEEFDNLLRVEAIDDNGEKGIDSIAFLTSTKAPPNAGVQILPPRRTYFAGDEIEFQVNGSVVLFGGIQTMAVAFSGLTSAYTDTVFYASPNNPPDPAAVYRFSKSLPIPDTYVVKGLAWDNCGDGAQYQLPGNLRIEKNSPPSLSFQKSTPQREGDSLRVQFFLSVSDPNATSAQDSIKSVRVTWDQYGTEIDTVRHRSISEADYHRMLPFPAPGVSYTIQIHAEDLHQGGQADTSFKVQAP